MKYKELLIKLGEQTEEKILQIRALQKQIAELLKDRTPQEMEQIKEDPELGKLDKKLNQLMNEIW